MAIKAFALVTDSETSAGDNTRVKLFIKVNILGSDLGDLEQNDVTIAEDNIAVGLGLPATIADRVQTWMEGHEIEFTLGDIVYVYSLA